MEPEHFTNRGNISEAPVSAGEYPPINGSDGFEKAPASPEGGKDNPGVPPSIPSVSSATPLLSPLQPPAIDDNNQSTTSQSADDGTSKSVTSLEDLKKWYIEKAAKAISSNKHDPYAESQQLEQIKRDYLRDIYHREIKLTSE